MVVQVLYETKNWRFLSREGGLPYKMDGAARRILWKEPLRDIKILFCENGLEFFSPLSSTNSKTKHYFLSFYLAQYPKSYRESSRCGPLDAEHPKRRYQNRFFNPEKVRWTPPSFLYGRPPVPGLGNSNICCLHMSQVAIRPALIYHEPLARVIAQALPVFDIKFAFFCAYLSLI